MNNQDRRDALIDALRLRAGVVSAATYSAHPSAQRFSEENVLVNLAETCAALTQKTFVTSASAFAFGLGTSDFKSVLASILRDATVQRLTAHAKHRALCSYREVIDFKDVSFPSLDVDLLLTEPVDDAGEFDSNIRLTSGVGLSARLRAYGRNIAIGREAIRNDDIGLMAGLFVNVGAAAARHEAKLVYDLLESNPTMGDGAPMLHVDHGNIEASALDATSLASAMGKLRTMRTPANALADLDAKHIVVSAELEYAATKLIKDAGLDLTVCASPWLATGRWYLLADPEQSPVVGLLHLKASRGGLVVGPRAPKTGSDDISIGIRFDVGVVPVGRVGVVRGGA